MRIAERSQDIISRSHETPSEEAKGRFPGNADGRHIAAHAGIAAIAAQETCGKAGAKEAR
jgi:hypothetical protein